MQLTLSPADQQRALAILKQPQTALSFADRYWVDRTSDPPGTRSRAGHALLGALVRAGLVRRLGTGTSYDHFLAGPPDAQTETPAAVVDVPIVSTPVDGVTYDVITFTGLRINGVPVPDDGRIRDVIEGWLYYLIEQGDGGHLTPMPDGSQPWLPPEGMPVRLDQAAHALWVMQQRCQRLEQIRYELGVRGPGDERVQRQPPPPPQSARVPSGRGGALGR